MSVRDVVLILLVVTLWGFNFPVAKLALAEMPPFLMTAIRFAMVAALLAPFFRPRLEQIPTLIGIALTLGAGHFGLLFLGLSGMDAAASAVVVQLGTPFSLLLAWIFFGENPGWIRWLGVVTALFGVAVLAGDPALPSFLPLGITTAAMLSWAISNMQAKKVQPIHPLALTGWMALFAIPMLLTLSFFLEKDQLTTLHNAHWLTWSCITYTAVCSTVIAYGLWYRLLGRYALPKVAPFTFLGPVIGMGSSAMILGEHLSWQKLAGGALVLIGVAVAQILGNAAANRLPAKNKTHDEATS